MLLGDEAMGRFFNTNKVKLKYDRKYVEQIRGECQVEAKDEYGSEQ